MKKRLLSILLCLAMVFAIVSVSAFAVPTGSTEHTHCVCGNTSCKKTSNGHGRVTWKAWTDYTKLPTEAGNYYLVYDVKISYTWKCQWDVNICLNGKTITCTSINGTDDYDVIEVADGKSLTITDCQATVGKITHAENAGGCGIENLGTLTMWNGSITGNGLSIHGNNAYGAGVYNNGGTFIMNGGSITENIAVNTTTSIHTSYNGGGVYSSGGTFIMNGGSITNNSGNCGGGVFTNGGTFTMNGGSITGNHAANDGGGVYNSDVFNMYGGSISNNSGRICGGGVYNNALFTMGGGSIINNNVTLYYGGGLYNNGTFDLSGNVKITGNKIGGSFENGILTGGENNNVHIIYGFYGDSLPIQSTSGLGSDASVGITGMEDQTVVSGTENTNGFFCDDTSYKLVSNNSNGLMLAPSFVHGDHCICGKSDCADANHGSELTWKAIRSLNEITKAGNYYLKQNVTLDGTWTCAYSGVNLCLNGKTITGKGGSWGISISNNKSLTITDCHTTAGKITHKSGESGMGIWNGGTLTLWNGTITGHTYDKGAGVYNYQSTFNMYGGSITGNSADYGAGVYNWGKLVKFNMYGGSITGNNASTSGGGMYNYESIFNMYGGSITGNSAGTSGGGIYNCENEGILNMSGGSITGNSADCGAGVYNRGIFTMSGGNVTGNNALSSGGGVYNVGKINMYGAPNITGNKLGGTFRTDGTLIGGTVENVYLTDDTAITVTDAMNENASVGITCTVGNTVVTGTTSLTGFFSDNTEYWLNENEDDGLRLSNEAIITGKLLSESGGTELEGSKKTYDGKSVVCANLVTKAGGGIDADITYDYSWQQKDENEAYNTITGLTGSTGPSGAGDYKLTVTAMKNNEVVAIASWNFTIEKAQLAVIITVQDKEYDGKTDAAVNAALNMSGVVNNDDISLVTGGVTAIFDNKNFGTNKPVTLIGNYELSGSAASNYTLVLPSSLTANINKKNLTIKNLAVANKIYDGTNIAVLLGTPILSGVVDGEDVGLIEALPSFTRVSAGKNIPISFTAFSLYGTDIANYTLIQPTGITANITSYFSDKSEYRVNAGSDQWLSDDFIVTANEGWQLSYSNTADGEWLDIITVSQESNNGALHFYVKNKESGIISEEITEYYKIDKTLPTGEIRIDNLTPWQKFLKIISFNLFFKNEQTVTITAVDNGSNISTIEYLLTSDDLNIDQLKGKTFTNYKNPFGIKPNAKLIIYAKLTDIAGNVNYLRSDGIVLDSNAPVINGAENGKTYCSAVTLTISDEYLKEVILNRNTVTLTDGKLTLEPAAGVQTVVATDMAGNSTTITVTVNDGHTWGDWTSNGDGTHKRICKFDISHTDTADCRGGTATCQAKAICDDCRQPYGDYGTHDWNTTAWDYKDADGHAHICKNEGCNKNDTIIAHTKNRDEATEDDPITCTECGYVITPALSHICANHLTPVEAKAATCTEPGNNAHYKCTCGKLFEDATASVEMTEAQTIIAPLGHEYEWKIDKEATAGEKGLKHEECKVCHHKKEAVEIQATGEISPSHKTGDNSMIGLWIALLFVSGAGVIGTTIYSKKKNVK